MLDELEKLLVTIAAGEVPTRGHAAAYSTLRLWLVQTYDPGVVPGFLYQCLSIHRYREFITLYDGRPAERRRFLTDVFDRLYASTSPRTGTTQDVEPPQYVSRVF